MANSVGWIGLGRMGEAMVKRLLKAGNSVSVWNRTAAKATPLAEYGAAIVATKQDLSGCDVVFTMVSTTDDLKEVLFGEGGLVAASTKPKVVVDSSSISQEGSAEIRARLEAMGVAYLCTPVSGNAKVAKAGKLLMVSSGPRAVYDMAEPFLQAMARKVMWVGEGELARIWKIAHNTMFGVVIQNLCEITILAEKAGIARTYQIPRPFAHLSVLQNVALVAMFGGAALDQKQATQEAWKWLEFTGLQDKADALPDELNLHQRKFLELTRALASRPRLVLLDEVLSGLTPGEINEAIALIRKIRDRGATIVFVEHVMRAVMALADRVAVLNYGKLIAVGPAQDVMKNSEVVSAYLGAPHA